MLLQTQDVAVQAARAALAASPVFALRELDVDMVGERMIILGSVNCFYHKQLAQEVVRNAATGVRVVNAVSVDDKQNRSGRFDEPSFFG
jgi:hypothetical protein